MSKKIDDIAARAAATPRPVHLTRPDGAVLTFPSPRAAYEFLLSIGGVNPQLI